MNEEVLAFAKMIVEKVTAKKAFPIHVKEADKEWIIRECKQYIDFSIRMYQEQDCFKRFNMMRKAQCIEERLKTYCMKVQDKEIFE